MRDDTKEGDGEMCDLILRKCGGDLTRDRTWSSDTPIGIKSDWVPPELVEVEEIFCKSTGDAVDFTEADSDRFRFRQGSEALYQWGSYRRWNEKRIESEVLLNNARKLAESYVRSTDLLNQSRKSTELYVDL